MDRYLGNMGENDFARLCAAGGLSCNKSSQDVTGWDFIVEFPFHLNTAPLADKAASPIECKVQVKATDGLNRKVQIEISNLMRICKYPGPAFVILLEYDKKELPQRAYLFHIDNEMMFKVLKRSREISVSEKKVKFNKATMTLNFTDDQALTEVSSAALIAKIKNYIPDTLQRYITEKIKNMDNLGYEKGRSMLTFSTPTPESINDFVDALIGLRNPVQVANVFGFDCRFGINVLDESMSSQSAIIQILDVQSTTTGELKFYNKSESKTLRFECEIFTPPKGAKIPKKYLKVRMKCELFDMLINIESNRFDFKFRNEDEPSDIFKLRDTLTLMEWLWVKDSKFDITLTRHDNGKKASYSGLPINNSMDGNELKENITNQLQILNDAMQLTQHLGMESYIKVTQKDLYKYGRSISAISKLIKKTHPATRISFNVNQEPRGGIDRVCCLIVLSCCIGDFRFYCISTFTGNTLKAESDYSLLNTKVKVHDFFECRRSENITEVVQEKVNLIASEHDGEDITVVDFFSQHVSES